MAIAQSSHSPRAAEKDTLIEYDPSSALQYDLTHSRVVVEATPAGFVARIEHKEGSDRPNPEYAVLDAGTLVSLEELWRHERGERGENHV